jgi:hypothetical protein
MRLESAKIFSNKAPAILCSLVFIGSMLLPERVNGIVVPIIRLTAALTMTEVFGLRSFIQSAFVAATMSSTLIIYSSITHRWAAYDLSLDDTKALSFALPFSRSLWEDIAITSIVAFWLSLIIGCYVLWNGASSYGRKRLWLRLVIAITSLQCIKLLLNSIGIWVGVSISHGQSYISGKFITHQITLEIAYCLIYLAIVVPFVILCARQLERLFVDEKH